MRIIPGLLCLLLLGFPAGASGQSFQVQGAIGPNVWDTAQNLSYGLDPGLSLSAGVGLTMSPRVAILLEIERTRRASQEQIDARGEVFGYPGGTSTLGVAQVRASLFGPDRLSPYVIVGFAAGVSRRNVTERLPESTSNDVRAVVIGGGITAPLSGGVSLFADGRFLVGGEEPDSVFGIAPIRAGLAWKF